MLVRLIGFEFATKVLIVGLGLGSDSLAELNVPLLTSLILGLGLGSSWVLNEVRPLLTILLPLDVLFYGKETGTNDFDPTERISALECDI